MWVLWLFLIAPEINSKETESCANIACEHNNVNVCGVRADGSKEVAFRLFQDECALRKFECEETELKGFRPASLEYCTQAFSLDTRRNKNSMEDDTVSEETQIRNSESDGTNANSTYGQTETTDTYDHPTCIQCDCNIKSKTVCAIRADGVRFIVRWFADKCHMLQFNCENNLNFSVTDYNICVGDSSSENYTIADKTDEMVTRINEEIENVELVYESEKTDMPENEECLQSDCITDNIEICAIRPEGEHFIIRWFNNKCRMLLYNCEKHVNFTIIEDSLCVGVNNYTGLEETPIIDSDITELTDTTELLDVTDGITTSATTVSRKEEWHNFHKESYEKEQFPKNVIVSTFNMNENINQTVDNFFAASHLTGIRVQKLEDEETRRMIIKDTGPVNVFVPRAFVPANYTPVENRNQSKQYPEYSPLVKYCYHKCPQKCPEFYKPVCGARIDNKKQTPFLFFRNHCYMDIAKCQMWWAGYKGNNLTELEELGFIFCGGYKVMNMMYMFPLIRILQRMGRLKKKGKVHFMIRNLGQFPIPLQG